MKQKSGGGWFLILVIFAVLYFTCFRDCTFDDVQANPLTQSVMSCLGQSHTSYNGFDGGSSRGAGGGGR